MMVSITNETMPLIAGGIVLLFVVSLIIPALFGPLVKGRWVKRIEWFRECVLFNIYLVLGFGLCILCGVVAILTLILYGLGFHSDVVMWTFALSFGGTLLIGGFGGITWFVMLMIVHLLID